jgi:hypothetical protein
MSIKEMIELSSDFAKVYIVYLQNISAEVKVEISIKPLRFLRERGQSVDITD